MIDKTIVAIDPGSVHNGWVLFQSQAVTPIDFIAAPGTVKRMGECDEKGMVEILDALIRRQTDALLVVEMVGHYGKGMPAGKDVYDTCVWIGRLLEHWRPKQWMKVERTPVRVHLCGSAKAKPPNVRRALLDRWPGSGGGATPQIGTKPKPGPLRGMVGDHMWAALAAAVSVSDVWPELLPKAVLGGGK